MSLGCALFLGPCISSPVKLNFSYYKVPPLHFRRRRQQKLEATKTAAGWRAGCLPCSKTRGMLVLGNGTLRTCGSIGMKLRQWSSFSLQLSTSICALSRRGSLKSQYTENASPSKQSYFYMNSFLKRQSYT